MFGAAEVETSIQLDGNIIIDDLVNEAQESFVMILETNDSNTEFIANREALRFDIFDNDGE